MLTHRTRWIQTHLAWSEWGLWCGLQTYHHLVTVVR